MECTEAMDAVENVFEDFKARKAGMVKALTTDFEEFYKQCDPGKENLCLYGFPSEKWEVRLPEEMVPPELPEPVLGINFVRDTMPKMDWLTEIAAHSEAWLLAVAYHFSTRFCFDKNDRKHLFNMINNLPSLYEVVTCSAEKTSSSSETMRSKYEHEGAKSVEDRDGGNTQSVERVFRDFKGRRAGLLKALTTGVEEFYQLCDPEMKNLCLFGLPNETWEVSLPPQELPQNLPEPALGINFARDGMQKMDWLALVALHSDTWLLSMAYFLGTRFDKAERERLFDKIFDLPTLFEVVVSSSREEVYKKSSHPCHGSNESTSNLKEDSESQAMDVDVMQMQPKKEAEENFEDEHIEEYGGTLCGGFGLNWSFVGEMFGRWKLSIDNGYAPYPQKKM